MHLFIAAAFTNNYMRGQRYYATAFNDRERQVVDNVPNVLESYHYVSAQKFVDEMRAANAKVFLDSGAFSAHSLGVSIDIDAYCDYIKKNRDILRVEDGAVMASVLDGIGDPLQTWRNQLYMEAQGAAPLPCFHFGEDDRYLEWYVQRYSYITLGGMVRRRVDDLITWLDRIWEKHLLDGSGRPKLKVHAFGITTERIMERYPWYSVDSSSWIQAASFGSVYTEEFGPVAVSSQSPSRHDEGRHLSTMTQVEREQVLRVFEQDGFNYERLSTTYQSRAAYNMLGYVKLNGRLNEHFARCNGILDCHAFQQLF